MNQFARQPEHEKPNSALESGVSVPEMDEVVPSGTSTSVTPSAIFTERDPHETSPRSRLLAKHSKSVLTFNLRITGAFSHTGDHQRVATLFLLMMVDQKPAAGHYGVFLIKDFRLILSVSDGTSCFRRITCLAPSGQYSYTASQVK